MDLKIGDIAPDFAIEISSGQQVKLSEMLGKNVVLYFYPKDNTPGCTLEGRDFSSLKDEFEKLDALIIGVSKDDIKSHCSFKDRFNITVDLGYDANAEISRKYGVVSEKSIFGRKYMGINRTTFFIDRAGRIAYIWGDVSVFGHAKVVLEEIKKHELNK